MKATSLFALGKTNTESPTFSGGVQITGFNLRPYRAEGVEIGECGFELKEECGDYVYFEELLFDGEYDISCCEGLQEAGALLSEVVKDECGELLCINAHCNSVKIEKQGIYRAIYVGDGRADAAVVYVSL